MTAAKERLQMYPTKNQFIHLFLIITTTVVQIKSEDKWVWSTERSIGSSKLYSNDDKVTVAKPILKEVEDLVKSASEPKKSAQVKRLFDELDDLDAKNDIKRARYEVNEEADGFLNGGVPQSSLYSRLPPAPVPYAPKPYPPDQYIPQSSANSIRRQQPAPAASSPLGILTGPVPSWEKPVLHKNGDPTSFQRCKCSFSFNCKSPGIHFGTCDQGKEYCCYNDVAGAESRIGSGTPAPSIDRYDRGPYPSILVGPEGPIDNLPPGLGPREPFHKVPANGPPFSSNYGVLGSHAVPEYDRRPPPLPQKPVLPPYVGLHNDYRSS